MIEKIELKGYKSIRSLSLDLKPINILIGGNGVGKSNFISLFSLVRNIYQQNLQNFVQKKGGANSLLYFGRKETEFITINLSFERGGERNKLMLDLEAGQDNLFIKTLRTAYKSRTWVEKEYENNVLETKFNPYFGGQAFFVSSRLEEFEVYHFHDTSDSSPIKGFSDLHDNERLRSNGRNLAAFLYYLQSKKPKTFKRIELTVKSIAPFFDCFVLKPNRLNEQKIQLEWKEKGFPETYFNAYHLSDGTLRFICLATLLMQPDPPATLIIDEPELGLHPVAINKLAALIRKASADAQIILSTQSVDLINNFEPEDIIVTDRRDNSSVFRRLSSEELQSWLEEYTIGEIWGQNKIGAQPYTI